MQIAYAHSAIYKRTLLGSRLATHIHLSRNGYDSLDVPSMIMTMVSTTSHESTLVKGATELLFLYSIESPCKKNITDRYGGGDDDNNDDTS